MNCQQLPLFGALMVTFLTQSMLFVMNLRKFRGERMLQFYYDWLEQKRGEPNESLNIYALFSVLFIINLIIIAISASLQYQLLLLKMDVKQDIQFAFNIDRGGTFTDFYVQQVIGRKVVSESAFKVLSESFNGEGPVVGIKQFFKNKGIMRVNDKIPVEFINHINLGTTIATNALLQRKGCKNAMILTHGFGDLLKIRHQARPNIFDLKCQKKPPLTRHTFELNERVFLFDNQQNDLKAHKRGNKEVYIRQPSPGQLSRLVYQLKHQKIQSVAISFCNSYLYGDNQRKVRQFLLDQGIKNVEIGSNYHDIGYLKRSETASLDAFLNPIMSQYFTSFLSHFDHPNQLLLRIMKSDGGFDKGEGVKASQLLLSGPAGGLIGCQSIIETFQECTSSPVNNLICLDMGGTSTDISRIQDKQFSTNYSFEVEGIQICTPHLQIDTIAAGGGSKLSFQNGMFLVGPESVGSNPGPVCYGIGQQLALTDANLILNRLDATYFPKIFGKDKDKGLNKEASIKALELLAQKINKLTNIKKSIYEIAEGFIEISNELMAKSARKLLTQGIPDALVIFGSAGGQHCCDLALKIGVNNVFIHKYSGILSAYGLSKAVETKENKHFLGLKVTKESFNYAEFIQSISHLMTNSQSQSTETVYQIGLGYFGTSYTIKVGLGERMIEAFQVAHKKQNGFSLQSNLFRIEYFIEKTIKYPDRLEKHDERYSEQKAYLYEIKRSEIFMDGRFIVASYYDIQNMKNCTIDGPALLLSSTSSILLKRGWKAHVTHTLTHLIQQNKTQNVVNKAIQASADPIKLTLYSTRLMSIAEEMGKVLQKISISTNIRERLDFSCGLFDWEGKLLANAPHLPVHLGSMETAVTEQIKRGIKIGEVVLSNHPAAGGSHLPDLTVISCIEVDGTRMYLASRGHHADIGGITPGSMPAFSKKLSEEGVAVEQFQLIEQGHFREAELRELFRESRRLDDNVSDLLAQIAANQIGAKLLGKLISEYGVDEFKAYVGFICDNAAESVKNLLYDFSLANNLQQIDTLRNTEYMDDGTAITLALQINRKEKNAVFDFKGSGFEVVGNTNAPQSITRSAILYCLRSLIGTDIPLNSGCLRPLTIIIPHHSILSPSKQAAVVGGNVETSQKLVDLILKPFQFVACSQGTMNNFLFGNSHCCYYETICGGSGAGENFNGTTTQCHMTNTRITDVETLEKIYPVIVREFKEKPDSGGKGRHRGGNGVVREFQFTESVTVSLLSERRVFNPYGLKGGQSGAVGRNILIGRNGVWKNIGGKNTLQVSALERVRVETPGGGGYGSCQQDIK